MEITYNPTIQPSNKADIERHLKPLLWLVPQWALYLHINLWDSVKDNCGELACICIDYDYRRLTLDFSTAWLDRPEDEKAMAVIHELIHGFIGILANYARDSFDLLCPEAEAEKFNKHLQKELIVRHESATQDLAMAIFNKFQFKEAGRQQIDRLAELETELVNGKQYETN